MAALATLLAEVTVSTQESVDPSYQEFVALLDREWAKLTLRDDRIAMPALDWFTTGAPVELPDHGMVPLAEALGINETRMGSLALLTYASVPHLRLARQ
jgi:hypothetical protein